MGSGGIGGFLGNLVNIGSFGLTDALGITGKTPEAKTVPIAAQIAEDKKNSAKKRKALYATKGGVLGQEVNQVGGENRGNLFGN